MQMLVKQHFARHTTALPAPVAFSTRSWGTNSTRHRNRNRNRNTDCDCDCDWDWRPHRFRSRL